MKNLPLLLDILASIVILSSILVITSRNPVMSVLYLIVLFLSISLYLILNGLVFIGLAYILVYIGAITVLFLFVIMMINIKLVDIIQLGNEYTKSIPLGIFISFFLLYEIISISPYITNNISIMSYPIHFLLYLNNLLFNWENILPKADIHSHITPLIDTIQNQYSHIESLGIALYSNNSITFLLLSILLLLSMVAPIILSRNK